MELDQCKEGSMAGEPGGSSQRRVGENIQVM